VKAPGFGNRRKAMPEDIAPQAGIIDPTKVERLRCARLATSAPIKARLCAPVWYQ
jgi:hypothetical protein